LRSNIGADIRRFGVAEQASRTREGVAAVSDEGVRFPAIQWFFKLSRVRTHPARTSSSYNTLLLISGAAVNFVFLVVLMVFSYLREEPLFWMNEGQFPIWMRDLVSSTYYPMLLLEFALLSALSGVSVRLLSTRSASASLAVVLLPILWGLYLIVIANSVANNLDNLLHGRPLHWHPDAAWHQL
jgi:hypothetical protein